ncbi:amylo-alpha-1,6-glucosidase, partial [Pseudomonas sp. GW456-12-10-14-LB2]|uniref:amylo-alpha-1,6-glucosidase n=1 Tax=Pseudomonas sp. GW456-12-10-14-LB2 TaxID=2070674 RepID=UPI0021139427
MKIYEAHVGGSLPEIAADPFDGLLRQGSPHTQLTWMDAQVDGRPVTPRDGKPVEINGLWIDALATGLEWLQRFE